MRLHCLRLSTLVLAVSGLTGCSAPLWPGGDCLDIAYSTIVVDVVHATTGEPIAVGSTVVVRGNAFYDSVFVTQAYNNRTAYTAFETTAKAGRYTVQVRKPGFLDYVNPDVEVKSESCGHSRGSVTTAALTPRT